MPSVRVEDLSAFGQLALKLDREFGELERAGGQIAHVNLESDNGLDEGIKILGRVARYGESVAQTMQEFSKALNEAREKAEAATGVVAERAQVIQQRKQKQDELHDKLAKVKAEVSAFGSTLGGFERPAKGEPTDEDKKKIAAELERIQGPLAGFIEAVQALKAECAGGNFKRLERQADSMIDSLQSTRRKIEQAIAPK
jgi:hypothetical protein